MSMPYGGLNSYDAGVVVAGEMLRRMHEQSGMFQVQLFAAPGGAGSSGEDYVGRGIQRGLGRVLHHADDEADRDHLHRHIRRDAKQRRRHWDQQQRSTCNARHAGSRQR